MGDESFPVSGQMSLGKLENPDMLKMLNIFLADAVGAERKNWMSAELFEDWVRELDPNFGSDNRKIASTVDNCIPHVENLEWTEFIFLPSRTKSHTQPINQGVI